MENCINIKQIEDGLNVGNIELIIQTIKELRVSGTTECIPHIMELLHKTDNSEVKKNITNFLNDLKHRDTVPLIMDAICEKKYNNIQKPLLSICWESSLDFGAYLPVFVDIVISNDFENAFEAFTVIENMASKIDDSVKNEQIRRIKEVLPEVGKDKAYLLNNLIEIIPNIKEEDS